MPLHACRDLPANLPLARSLSPDKHLTGSRAKPVITSTPIASFWEAVDQSLQSGKPPNFLLRQSMCAPNPMAPTRGAATIRRYRWGQGLRSPWPGPPQGNASRGAAPVNPPIVGGGGFCASPSPKATTRVAATRGRPGLGNHLRCHHDGAVGSGNQLGHHDGETYL